MNETKSWFGYACCLIHRHGLYEAVPVGQQHVKVGAETQTDVPERLLSAKLQVRTSGDDGTQFIERAVGDVEVPFVNAPLDLKFAASVAEFGMILRDSEYKGEWNARGSARLGTGRKGCRHQRLPRGIH